MITIEHKKSLNDRQYDLLKGTNVWSQLFLNRVSVTISPDALQAGNPTVRGRLERLRELRVKKVEQINQWLDQNCKNFYHVNAFSSSTSINTHFVSEDEMEEFIVWAKLAL